MLVKMWPSCTEARRSRENRKATQNYTLMINKNKILQLKKKNGVWKQIKQQNQMRDLLSS